MAASELTVTNGATPGTPGGGDTTVFVNTSKHLSTVNDAGLATTPWEKTTTQTSPSDPTGTTNTTGLMAGIGASFTPTFSGNVLIVVSGNMTNSGATAGQGAKAQIRLGTGTAPANGDALTGTAYGTMQTGTLMRATADLIPFSIQAIVTGLVVATAYWIDLQVAALTSGTGQVKNLSVSAAEQ